MKVEKPESYSYIFSKINEWSNFVIESKALGEENLEQSFNQLIFSEILNYQQPPGEDGYFQFLPKIYASGGSAFPDFILGKFKLSKKGNLENDIRIVVGELKGPNVDLDKVDSHRLKSPVEQGFDYAIRNGLNVKWIIVSNMKEIRLYHHSSIDHYQRWYISEFIDGTELTDTFWEFYFMLYRDYLLGWPEQSKLENLLDHNISERIKLTDNFYHFYRQAIQDVYSTISEQLPEIAKTQEGRLQIIHSSQNLIHRGLVTCFFSDHPARLLPQNILKNILEHGKGLPVLNKNKIYPLLRALFTCIDQGSPEEYPFDIFGYNGGLFAHDPILDNNILPDSLFNKKYKIGNRIIEGIFGFHVFDFHSDLNEHLLGKIFEETISDLEQIHTNISKDVGPFYGIETRKNYGLFFTREVLTDYVAKCAIDDLLKDKRNKVHKFVKKQKENDNEYREKLFLEKYLKEILNVKIADIACGSGAFLVSCFNHLRREIQNIFDKLSFYKNGQLTLKSFTESETKVIEQCVYGNDIMHEAVEISKLSMWIRSARRKQSLGMLTGTFASENALTGEINFSHNGQSIGFSHFDLIIGNPPWGARISDEAKEWTENTFSKFDTKSLDSYELFILTALKYLKNGGRLAYVLPHSLLLPDHKLIRKFLLENFTLERYHNLGAEWFGSGIRMNTTILQIKNMIPDKRNKFKSMTLVDRDRKKAIEGKLNLSQIEAAYSFKIPQQRCIDSGEIELFRYERDDEIMKIMDRHSIPLGALCKSHRGIELNKEGHIIQCPSCGLWTPPSAKRKGGTFKKKTCDHCGTEFEIENSISQKYIVVDDISNGDEYYIDGDSFGVRYEPLKLKAIKLGYDGINYKESNIYVEEKIFIRQAGVGMSAGLTNKTIYCPQSVFIYKIRDSREEILDKIKNLKAHWADLEDIPNNFLEHIDNRLLLGILNSRLFNYYIFKRFGEIDAAQAFAKLTQTKIRSLPIPVVELGNDKGKKAAENIILCVEKMLESNKLGQKIDWKIDRHLSILYGLDGNHRRYITSQMGLVAYHKVLRELYPFDPPPKPERKDEIKVEIKNK